MADVRRRVRERALGGGAGRGEIRSVQGCHHGLREAASKQQGSLDCGIENATYGGDAADHGSALGQIRGRSGSLGQSGGDDRTAHPQDARFVAHDGLVFSAAVSSIRGRSRSPGFSSRGGRDLLLRRLRGGAAADLGAAGHSGCDAAAIRADGSGRPPPAPGEPAAAASGFRGAAVSPGPACCVPRAPPGDQTVAARPVVATRAPAVPAFASSRNARAELLRQLSASGS